MVLIRVAQHDSVEPRHGKSGQLGDQNPVSRVPFPEAATPVDQPESAARQVEERRVPLTHVEKRDRERGDGREPGSDSPRDEDQGRPPERLAE